MRLHKSIERNARETEKAARIGFPMSGSLGLTSFYVMAGSLRCQEAAQLAEG
jgi:hypothetical protein